MSEVNEKILFTGVLNTDDSQRNLPVGDYPDAINNRIHVTEKGKDGDAENIKGNLFIQYTLPNGLNKIIGSYEDKARKRIIYCNYNSNSNHGIYQFFPDQGTNGTIETIRVDPILGFDVNHKITGINVVESQTGDLFCWTDNFQRPRKINIDKSNETSKKRKYNIFIQKNIGFGITFTTTIFDPNGIAVFTWSTLISPSLIPANTLEEIIKYYYNNIPLNPYVSFTTCYQFLTAEMNSVGTYTMTISSNNSSITPMAVSENFYPSPFKEEFIDAIKYPTDCQPNVTVKQDTSKSINLIQNKIFQFRIKLVYDDNEKSVWSPYSVIPEIPISCAASSTQSSYNFIEVDFNSQRLFDLGSLSIIQRIEVSVREHNIDQLRYVTFLEKWQFLSAINQNTYNFYNDIIESVIDPAESLKNYDALPLLSKSQEFVNNRIFYGGITEGYDSICVDAKINLSYQQDINTKTYSLSGKVFIKNLFSNNSNYQYSQPIYNRDGNGYVFGGIAPVTVGNGLSIVATTGTSYQQSIPLGGFVMYLAGTNYYGISKQPSFYYNSNGDFINQDGNGVIIINGNAKAIDPCGSSNASDERKVRCRISQVGPIWSNYTISNIPPGKYVLRVASHLTTSSDLNSNSIGWQKTSSYTLQVGGGTTAGRKNEAVIEIKINGDIYVDNVFISSANGFIGETHIADLTDPVALEASIGMAGYVTDADITPTPANISGLFGDTRIDLAQVAFNYSFFLSGINYNNFYQYNDFINKIVYTDHNGFFWWTCQRNITASGMNINYINVIGNQKNIGAFTSYELSTGGSFTPSTAKGTNYGLFRIASSAQFDNERTKLQGTVSYNGQPISGLNILSTKGVIDTTDSMGEFNIVVYGDTYYYFISGGQKIRSDLVLFAVADNCLLTFNPTAIPYSLVLGSGTGSYNYSNPYPITGITITSIIGQGSLNALKRGGNYSIGFVYFNHALQDNNVNTSESLDLKIPFYTEYNSATATIVGQSLPIVEIDINHLPPSWATHYQVVRTLNGNQGKFLQWTAKTVTYIDEDGNTVPFTQAIQVKIDLESITTYDSRNVDSLISYTYEDGDRLVLIKNGSTGNFYNQYLDFKIRGVKTGSLLVLYIDNLVSAGAIPAGSLFEIYNPSNKYTENLYYEIGQCYDIVNGFHLGNTQDQTFSQPAKVTLTNGDTYYRLRTIPYSTGVIGSACNAQKAWYIEDPSISDFYKSNDQSIGRFHIYDKDFGRRYRPSVIRFSNTFIPETKINGLNSFEGLNEKVLPLDYGLIQKLILAKDTLCAIHDNSEFLSMYIGKEVLLDQQLQNLVAVSDKVIQQSYQYNGGLGTQHPESVCINEENEVFGYDNNKGIVWQRNVNGLVPISEIKMWTYWRNKSTEIKSGGGTFVYGVYHNAFRQFILSIEGVKIPESDLYKINPDTIAYNTRKRGWESRYSFHPEYFGGARNNVLISFLGGQVFRHDSNPLYNNFYAVQYTRRIKAATRQYSSDMKNFQYISTESSVPLKTTNSGIVTLEGQQSELAISDFELIENVYRASFLKDLNTPNLSLPLIDGDDLRSSVLTSEMEDVSISYSTIHCINIYSILSQSTNK